MILVFKAKQAGNHHGSGSTKPVFDQDVHQIVFHTR